MGWAAVAIVVLIACGILIWGYTRATKQLANLETTEADERAELEREARIKFGQATAAAGEITDAAPPSLAPDARMDAVDDWVRQNADRLRDDARAGVSRRRRDPSGSGRKPD